MRTRNLLLFFTGHTLALRGGRTAGNGARPGDRYPAARGGGDVCGNVCGIVLIVRTQLRRGKTFQRLPRLNCPFQISAARDHLLRESICVEGRARF
jgi:hypothetical protein